MKKTIVKIGLLLLGIAVFYGVENKETTGFSALVLDNIDALAQEENGEEDVSCYGSGDIDCYGYKVEKRYVMR